MRSRESKGTGAANLPTILGISLLTFAGVAFPQAQSSQSAGASPPVFEVASIKLNTSGSGSSHSSSEPGSYLATNVRLKDLLRDAYAANGRRLENSQILNCPDWAAAKRYDVDAKMDDATTDAVKKRSPAEGNAAMNRALQSLLVDRFQLKVTEGTTEIPVYALVIAKGGAQLRKEAPDGPAGENADGTDEGLTFTGTLNGFAQELADMPIFSDRPVINHTGLTERYVIGLRFSPVTYAGLRAAEGSDSSDLPSIFTALEEQIGLRIDSTKAPMYTITIDHLEEPSPN
jgi:uncharacterized protein (TIGR03435 family)